MGACFKCGKAIEEKKIGRRDCCSCGTDLHACRNCAHYDRTAYNECRESSAERVLEKERSNYCDYFTVGSKGGPASTAKEDGKKKLDDLFK